MSMRSTSRLFCCLRRDRRRRRILGWWRAHRIRPASAMYRFRVSRSWIAMSVDSFEPLGGFVAHRGDLGFHLPRVVDVVLHRRGDPRVAPPRRHRYDEAQHLFERQTGGDDALQIRDVRQVTRPGASAAAPARPGLDVAARPVRGSSSQLARHGGRPPFPCRGDQQLEPLARVLRELDQTSPRIGESCSCRRSSSGPSRMNSTRDRGNLDRHDLTLLESMKRLRRLDYNAARTVLAALRSAVSWPSANQS